VPIPLPTFFASANVEVATMKLAASIMHFIFFMIFT